ncbi:MAG: adenine deaminase [Methanobacteriaceae archaeon]|nr:adenine deaminase [Methanobacteriaceae archaeon]
MLKGNILNVFSEEIYPAEIMVEKGIIKCVKPLNEDLKGYILPGFIDAHIHIESSMLTPSRFSEMVIPHGTTAVVADPHEIANVMGVDGIKYMIKDASSVPLKFFFTAPSCVPATPFETSGSILSSEDIDRLLDYREIVALGEMMNFPGVIGGDKEVFNKIETAKKHKKPIDGHAPLLTGDNLCKYVAAGISTDHECTQPQEAFEKRQMGMKIMLREGSSAKNLEDLLSVGGDFIVSDDKHPEDLLQGHLDVMIKKAVQLGLDPVKAIKMVTINPAQHYSLNNGAIQPGRSADLVIVDDLEKLNVESVYINGKLVSENGRPKFPVKPLTVDSTFLSSKKTRKDFEIFSPNESEKVRVIDVVEGQLITGESEAILNVENSKIQPKIDDDILKIAVVERYGHNRITNAFVRGFGLKSGAIASSVAHDSHNIIVVGTSGEDMARAVNLILKNKGGISITMDAKQYSLKLPIAGLMSVESAREVSLKLKKLHQVVSTMGSNLKSPFMTMSFMALLVIPKIKISDQGLFDVESFQFVDVIK